MNRTQLDALARRAEALRPSRRRGTPGSRDALLDRLGHLRERDPAEYERVAGSIAARLGAA